MLSAQLLEPENNFNAVEGTSFNGAVASFTDSSPDLPSDVSATINWGDGTLSAGIVSQPGAGMFTVIGNHTYAEEGSPTVTVTLHRIPDNSDHVATPSTATVKDAPLTAAVTSPVNCTEGAVCNLTVAVFTDADPNGVVSDYAATINWGDGTSSSPGTIVANGTGGFNVIGSHVYAEEGNYNASTHVADTGGSTVNMNISVSVMDAALSASGTTVNATEGTLLSNTVMATFTDADPSGIASDYSATINWGDGTPPSLGTIVANGTGGFNVISSHVYAEAGNYTASTHVADSGGSTTDVNTSVAVADAPLSASGTTINATEGTLISNAVMATFTDADPNGAPSDYNAIVDWGDGTRSAATIVATVAGSFNVIGTHIYTDEGNYNAQIAVADTGGSAINTNASVIVSDAALSISSTPPGSCTESISCNLTLVNFTDANSSATAGDYTATINWVTAAPRPWEQFQGCRATSV